MTRPPYFKTEPLDEFAVGFYPTGTASWQFIIDSTTNGFGNAFGKYNPRTKSATIDMFRVDPDKKRQGIGREWIAKLEEFLLSLGVSTVRGHAKEGSEEFWRAVGYSVNEPRGGHLPTIKKRITSTKQHRIKTSVINRNRNKNNKSESADTMIGITK